MTDSFRERLAAALDPAYAIDDELTGGGMSRVFLATERALGRRVVVKVLPPDLAAGVNRERFQREIQLAAQLQHPHIVPLLSAGESGGLLYYTMPYIEGESLRASIARRGRLPVREVTRILHDVIEALAYAHRRGVIHRDIKPGNILTLGSHALVTDFGVAKALSAAMPTSGMTSAGMAIGTPAYMAPEQLAADPSADHRMDLYAVGLLAYELLAGASPFKGESPQATMAAQLTRVPDPIRTIRDDVPALLSDLIMRCLEKVPEHRPPSADALLEALEGVITPVPPFSSTPTARLTAVSGVRSGVSPAVRFAGIALGVLALAGVVALGIWGGRRAAQTRARATADSAARVAVARGESLAARSDTIRAPIQLTHAESLAIADAIRKRMAPSPSVSRTAVRTQRTTDSLFLLQIERAIGDSVAKALDKMRAARGPDRGPFDRGRGASQVTPAVTPGMPGAVTLPAPAFDGALVKRRIAVVAANSVGASSPIADSLARMTSDSVRQLLRRNQRFEVVDASAAAVGGGSPRERVARAGAGAVVTTHVITRNDTAFVRIEIFDVIRGAMVRTFSMAAGPPADALRNVRSVVSRVPRALDLVAWPGISPGARTPRFQRPPDSMRRKPSVP